jgi:site-specific DNA-methyltransferase (adenine-specific)
VSLAPYYQDDHATIYHGDALDILPTLDPGSAQAVVTDPPYILGAGSHRKSRTSYVDAMNSATWFATWYRLAGDVLGEDGSLWTFANWRTLPVVMRAAAQAGLDVTSAAVWDKQWISTGGPRGLRSSYELCVLIPQPEFRVTNRGAPDVWRIQGSSHKPHGHPAEKPVALLAHVLTLAAVPAGALVVDPFMGSGTTLAAARPLGVRVLGIEADERWCEVAARRLTALGGDDVPDGRGTPR